jgi:hypothetical protein
MKRNFCAGVLALAMVALLPALPARSAAFGGAEIQAASIDIVRIRTALRLTPEQEPYWAPLETALRDLVRRQKAQAEHTGLVRRIGNRVLSLVLDSAAVERLAIAARPLVAKLDAQQMQVASGLVQEMGLGPVVAALM